MRHVCLLGHSYSQADHDSKHRVLSTTPGSTSEALSSTGDRLVLTRDIGRGRVMQAKPCSADIRTMGIVVRAVSGTDVGLNVVEVPIPVTTRDCVCVLRLRRTKRGRATIRAEERWLAWEVDELTACEGLKVVAVGGFGVYRPLKGGQAEYDRGKRDLRE